MRHVGIRPVFELTVLDFKRCLWVETFPDGSTRVWNKRMLRSGCNEVTKQPRELTIGITGEVLLYCPHCDEYYAKEQWREETL